MSVLDYAIRIIKATMKNHSNESFFPYFFIVGAGISVPEIPAAYEIIDECKDKSKKFDEISYIQFENGSYCIKGGLRYLLHYIG